jgi:transposase-like protein
VIQDLIKCDTREIERYISKLKGAHSERAYMAIKLHKVCPECKKDSPRRQLEGTTIREVPIIPLYVCDSCGCRSYHLTKEYLLHLVEKKRALFSAAEAAEYEKDPKKFVDELREYVIRIFASKRIMCIK